MRSKRVEMKKIRILIADREGVYRLGLKRIFAVEDDLRVVAQAENAAQVAVLAKKFQPLILYVQTEIVEEPPGNLMARVWDATARAKIVVTASALSEDAARRYEKAGAAGVILKSADPELFVKSAREVARGDVWLPKRDIARMGRLLDVKKAFEPRPVDTLTRREKSIISCLMQGWRNREIARHLSITEQTVKNHLRAIYDKVGVSDRLELVLYAIHKRLELPQVESAAHV